MARDRFGWFLFSALSGVFAAGAWSRGAEGDRPGRQFQASSAGKLDAAVRQRIREAWLAARAGDGGGGTVSNLLAVQVSYVDEDQKTEFWLTWSVDFGDRGFLMVFANGVPVVYEGTNIPVTLDPGTTEITVFGKGDVGIGRVLFEVVGDDSTASDEIIGLGSQPFGDPDPLTCREGTRDPETKACSLILEIKNSPQPEFYYVTFDGARLPETIPGVSQWTFPDVSVGEHTVALLGGLSVDGSDYLGDEVQTSCVVECRDLPCDSPFKLAACQNAFGPAEPDNKVELTWRNGELNYREIHVAVDSGEPKTLPGSATETLLEGLAPGEHTVSVEGDCGESGRSVPATAPLTVLAAPPQGQPLQDLTCWFPTPSASIINARWRNLTQASSIEVYLMDPQDSLRLSRTISGQATTVSVEGTLLTDRLGLRFQYAGAGACYSSELQVCAPVPPPGWKFLRGDCDANSNLDITDAIFSLNRLFRGGKEPACAPACDSNSDSLFNLADAIYSLSHLFRGGPPPDGSFPLCEETAPGELACGESTCNR